MQTHGKTLRAEVTPTLQILGAYVAGDAMGGLLEFALGGAGGGGGIPERRIYDKDNEKAGWKLYLFYGTAPPTAGGAAGAAGRACAVLKFRARRVAQRRDCFPKHVFQTNTGTGAAKSNVGQVL